MKTPFATANRFEHAPMVPREFQASNYLHLRHSAVHEYILGNTKFPHAEEKRIPQCFGSATFNGLDRTHNSALGENQAGFGLASSLVVFEGSGQTPLVRSAAV